VHRGREGENVTPEKKAEGWGDTWTWTGLDADTKLCVSYLVGGRSADWAVELMLDCANRIKGRVQVTTDGHKAYLEAVETAFGADIDYAMLQEDIWRTFRCRDAPLQPCQVHRF
jgi:hypothetical protein